MYDDLDTDEDFVRRGERLEAQVQSMRADLATVQTIILRNMDRHDRMIDNLREMQLLLEQVKGLS